jgi:3-phosphoshikimate 1-carboxyvinyltransferase
MQVKVSPRSNWEVTVNVPGDKSIAHRALILTSIAQGESSISNIPPGLDVRSTRKAMQALGAKIEMFATQNAKVKGEGLKGLQEPSRVIDAGNSGTTMRLLSGLLSGQNFFSVLNGDDSLTGRPMKRIIEPLKQMGANIFGRKNDSFAPLAIQGGKLNGIYYELPVPSAQVKSAILLAALFADSPTTIVEPTVSRDHTERMLDAMGAGITRDKGLIKLEPRAQINAITLQIPGDFSSAAYFIIAALLMSNTLIRINQVGINPTRTGLLQVLKNMGADIFFENMHYSFGGEPVANIIAKSSSLKGIEISKENVPSLIDEIPVLVVAATQAKGKTVVRGARELRVKESDRIAAMVSELKKMGANIEEMEDGFVIEGPTPLNGANCDCYKDHRIAMSLGIAALIASEETIINEAEFVDISFPGFWEHLGGEWCNS